MTSEKDGAESEVDTAAAADAMPEAESKVEEAVVMLEVKQELEDNGTALGCQSEM
jgi:hypothetical protein